MKKDTNKSGIKKFEKSKVVNTNAVVGGAQGPELHPDAKYFGVSDPGSAEADITWTDFRKASSNQ